MRIINNGLDKTKEVQIRCTCGCDFAYTKNDIHHDQRDGDYVICPWCKRFINHNYAAYRLW